MGPQCSGTLSAYSVAVEDEVMQGRKVGELGAQRSGSRIPELVAVKIEVLQGRKAGKHAPQRIYILFAERTLHVPKPQ